MDRFAKLHPLVLLLFFLLCLVLPLSFSNPIIAAAALLGALLYSLSVKTRGFYKTLLNTMLAIFFVSIFNMLFAHYGEDVLFTVKDVSFTKEALFYGFHQGMLIASSLLWFTALGRCLDSERLLYLFRFAPKSALLITMVLGFIPRFLQKLTDIREAQLALNGGVREKGLAARWRAALHCFSALVTYSLESSLTTADSMTARQYRQGAVRGDRFRMTAEDVTVLIVLLALSLFVIWQKAIGNLAFVFEPTIYIKRLSIPAVCCFTVQACLPAMLNGKEALQWKLSTVRN
ncbi:MAG: hypothetical protein IJ168_01735 [Eubacterium sp.]|nr:hypothetical protein [Eubacterium sp.]